MLSGTLLDNQQRQSFRQTGGNAAISVSGDALTRAHAGLRAYATLRAARRSAVLGDSAVASLENHRVGFEDVCASVAEAGAQIAATPTQQLIGAIPGLFQGASTGVAALRQYWLDLGYSASEVDSYVAEAVNAREGLAEIAHAFVQEGNNWAEAVKQFGAGNPNPIHWGFGFSSDGKLHPLALAFATTCRQAGLTPSLYVMASIVFLLDKLAKEVAAA